MSYCMMSTYCNKQAALLFCVYDKDIYVPKQDALACDCWSWKSCFDG